MRIVVDLLRVLSQVSLHNLNVTKLWRVFFFQGLGPSHLLTKELPLPRKSWKMVCISRLACK